MAWVDWLWLGQGEGCPACRPMGVAKIDSQLYKKTKDYTTPLPNPHRYLCTHIPSTPHQTTNLEPLDGVQVPNQDVAVDQPEVREQRAERGCHEVALGDGREVAEPLLCFCDCLGVCGVGLIELWGRGYGSIGVGGRLNQFERHTWRLYTFIRRRARMSHMAYIYVPGWGRLTPPTHQHPSPSALAS